MHCPSTEIVVKLRHNILFIYSSVCPTFQLEYTLCVPLSLYLDLWPGHTVITYMNTNKINNWEEKVFLKLWSLSVAIKLIYVGLVDKALS